MAKIEQLEVDWRGLYYHLALEVQKIGIYLSNGQVESARAAAANAQDFIERVEKRPMVEYTEVDHD